MQEVQGQPPKKDVTLNCAIDLVELEKRCREMLRVDPKMEVFARRKAKAVAVKNEKADKIKEKYFAACLVVREFEKRLQHVRAEFQACRKQAYNVGMAWKRARAAKPRLNRRVIGEMKARKRFVKDKIVDQMATEALRKLRSESRAALRDVKL